MRPEKELFASLPPSTDTLERPKFVKKSTATTVAILASIIATSAQAEVIVSPRFSYYFDNSNLRVSELADNIRPDAAIDQARTRILQDNFGDDALLETRDEGSGRIADQTTFPMFGGAVTVVDDNNQFTLTAMYGKGRSTVDTIVTSSQTLFVGDIAIDDVAVIRANDRINTKKYDAEFTWQRRLNENFAVFTGLRYERLETRGPVTVTTRETRQIDAFFADLTGNDGPDLIVDARPRPQRLQTSSTLETYSLRAGVTAFVPVDQSITAFFNGMAHVSYQPDYQVNDILLGRNDVVIGTNRFNRNGEISAGPDIAVGAQLAISDNISFDLRYRAILFFPLSGDFSFSDARVNHGVNMGLSFRL